MQRMLTFGFASIAGAENNASPKLSVLVHALQAYKLAA